MHTRIITYNCKDIPTGHIQFQLNNKKLFYKYKYDIITIYRAICCMKVQLLQVLKLSFSFNVFL